jgi:hypothetical protein
MWNPPDEEVAIGGQTKHGRRQGLSVMFEGEGLGQCLTVVALNGAVVMADGDDVAGRNVVDAVDGGHVRLLQRFGGKDSGDP